MGTQLQTIMAPDDEAAFLAFVFARPTVYLIPRERNPTPDVPRTREMRGVQGWICHLWDTAILPKLKVEFIPTCNDYYLRSEGGLIQFLRSRRKGDTLEAGRIALGGETPAAKAWYRSLERWLKAHFANSFVYASDFKPGVGHRERTVWVGPQAIALSKQGVSLKRLGPPEFSLRHFDPAEEATVMARYRQPIKHVLVGKVSGGGDVVDAQLRKRHYRVVFSGAAPVPALEGPFLCTRPEPQIGDEVACVLGENIFGRHPDPWEPHEIRKLSPKHRERILSGLRKTWRVE
jgi:hypothetical protein